MDILSIYIYIYISYFSFLSWTYQYFLLVITFKIIIIDRETTDQWMLAVFNISTDRCGPDDCESNVHKIKLISNKTRPENLIRRFQLMPMAQICIKRNFLHFILHFLMLMIEITRFVRWGCLHLIQFEVVITPCYSISSFSGWCKFGGHGL